MLSKEGDFIKVQSKLKRNQNIQGSKIMPVYIIDNNSQTKAGDSKKIFHEKNKHSHPRVSYRFLE